MKQKLSDTCMNRTDKQSDVNDRIFNMREDKSKKITTKTDEFQLR